MRRLALVVGCGEGVWDEVVEAQRRIAELGALEFDRVYCVKLAGVDYPAAFETWVTLHPEWMDEYEKMRRAAGRPGGYEIVAPLEGEVGMHGKAGRIDRRVTYRWPKMTSSASSGIYAAKVALDDGYDAVLAGIPMTGAKHYRRGKPWAQLDSFTPGYGIALPHLRGRVRSMSGYTRETLGEPTLDWLRGDPLPVNSAQVPA